MSEIKLQSDDTRMGETKSMIEVEKLTKTFNGFKALEEVSIHVERGSVYGLVGPNGAGKSSLINHIAGIYKPDSGDVRVDGEPVFGNPHVKDRIYCIHDEIYYHLGVSTRDLKRFLAGVYSRFDERRYERLAEAFPEVDERKPLRSLSKGMVKQAAFRLALSCRPDVLLLDEPVDGLDPIMRRRVWQLLNADVCEYGTTVLLSSHNLRELEDVCDHVGFLDKGSMVSERSLSDLQGSVSKVQVLFDPEEQKESVARIAELFELLHQSEAGRMQTLILRGSQDEVRTRIGELGASYLEVLPLNLEETFMYELGGASDELQEILL